MWYLQGGKLWPHGVGEKNVSAVMNEAKTETREGGGGIANWEGLMKGVRWAEKEGRERTRAGS